MKLSIFARTQHLILFAAALMFASAPPRTTFAETKPAADAKASAAVDLNKATEAQLEEVPGIGEATAKKIIKGRPYKTIDDLSKAGVSDSTITKIRSHVSVATDKSTTKDDKASSSKSSAKEEKSSSKGDKASASSSAGKSSSKEDKLGKSNAKDDKADSSASAGKSSAKEDKVAKDDKTANSSSATSKTDKAASTVDSTAKSSKPAVVDSKTALVNVNKASETELETVSGIGPTYASKIIKGRPYKTIDDLAKAGIPTSTIAKIRPLVTTSDSVASQVSTKPATADKTSALVDINKATAEQLQEVSGIGEVYSKKIVDNRPYKSVEDLSKAGIPASVIEKVKSQLTVDGATTVAAVPPVKGMVWVNLETKLYHKEDSRWYGKTKSGKFMTEAEAEKGGYKASKQ